MKFKKNIKKTRTLLISNYKVLLSVLVLLACLLGAFLIVNKQESHSPSQAYAERWLVPCEQEKCIQKGLETITIKHGTKAAMDSLDYYIHNVQNGIKGDNHLRAHYIGHQTVKTYGVRSQDFIDCSTRFDYGCMHGYLEQMIEDGMTPVAAAKSICGPIEKSSAYSSNMKHYCYHGIGHGVMDEEDYNLQAALDDCDNMGSQLAQSGCWQGVFMENVGASMVGDLRNFSKSDPLFPCNAVEKKYQRECYINQAGYLLKFYDWDVSKASRACLKAGENINDCMESIGLTASSDAWQKILVTKQAPQGTEYNAWLVCNDFPEGYKKYCVTGAVTQLLEIDRFNLSRAIKFCTIEETEQEACYQRVGVYMRIESQNAKEAADHCDPVPGKWQAVCRQAAA